MFCNQLSWATKHLFINSFFKYHYLGFINFATMHAPVISSLDEIYCTWCGGRLSFIVYSLFLVVIFSMGSKGNFFLVGFSTLSIFWFFLMGTSNLFSWVLCFAHFPFSSPNRWSKHYQTTFQFSIAFPRSKWVRLSANDTFQWCLKTFLIPASRLHSLFPRLI